MYRSFWTYSSSLLLLVILTACGQSAAPAARTAPDVSQDPVTIGGSADASRAPVTIGGSADASQAPVTIGGGNPGTELVPGNPSSHGGAVAAELDQIGPDGNHKGMTVAWKSTPHFFQKDKLLVLYVGDDAAVLGILTELLGAQVAGR
jgi:hypothetical protein